MITENRIPKKPLTRSLLAGLLCLGVLSGCSSVNQPSYSALQNVDVPKGWTADHNALPEALHLEPDQKVTRQTYSIDKNGSFAFSRSISVETTYLGLETRAINKGEAEKLGLTTPCGVLACSVKKDSPASKAGIVKNDIVVAFAAEPVRSTEQLDALVEGREFGSSVVLSVYRDGKQFDTEVELGSRLQTISVGGFQRELPTHDHRSRSGMTIAAIEPDLRPIVFGPYQHDSGLVVVDLLPGGPAFSEQVRIGDVITRVNGHRTSDLGHFEAALVNAEPGETIPMTIRRGDKLIEFDVCLEEDAMAKTSFKAIIISYVGSATNTSFSVLGHLLFRYFEDHSIETKADTFRHLTVEGWSLVLSLISFERTSEESRLDLAWIIPFRIKRG